MIEYLIVLLHRLLAQKQWLGRKREHLKTNQLMLHRQKNVLTTCPNMIEALINKQNITVHF